MRLAAALAVILLSGPAAAHDGVDHATESEAAAHKAETGAAVGSPTPALPFPVDIRAEFSLIDQDGLAVTQDDFAGKPMAIFFGYANCEAICSVALPRLGQALDILGDDIDRLTPLMITVDPARDTPETIGPALAKWHPKLRGLTGSEAALAKAREAFQVETSIVGEDTEGNPIYAHGSFIYLLDGEGQVLTLLPPILGPERMAEILIGYL